MLSKCLKSANRSAYSLIPTDMRNTGHILFECTIAILILGIFLALNTPGQWSREHRHQQIEQLLMTAIDQCRLLSMYKQSNSILCPSENGTTCADNWSGAYILCKQHKKTLVYNMPIPHTLSWHANFDNRSYITFRLDGSASKEQGHFTIGCDSASRCSYVYINHNGSARLHVLKA